MAVKHIIPVGNVAYEIVVKNWGEWQIRVGYSIIRCCMSTEEEAIEEMNQILKREYGSGNHNVH